MLFLVIFDPYLSIVESLCHLSGVINMVQFVFISVNLLRLMNAIVIEGNVSPRISFIVSLLDEAVKCGQKHSRYILQMIPPNMVS